MMVESNRLLGRNLSEQLGKPLPSPSLLHNNSIKGESAFPESPFRISKSCVEKATKSSTPIPLCGPSFEESSMCSKGNLSASLKSMSTSTSPSGYQQQTLNSKRIFSNDSSSNKLGHESNSIHSNDPEHIELPAVCCPPEGKVSICEQDASISFENFGSCSSGDALWSWKVERARLRLAQAPRTLACYGRNGGAREGYNQI